MISFPCTCLLIFALISVIVGVVINHLSSISNADELKEHSQIATAVWNAECPTTGNSYEWHCHGAETHPDLIDEVYLHCKYNFYAYFYSVNESCLWDDKNFNYVFEVNKKDHSRNIHVSSVNGTSEHCCIVSTSAKVKQANNTLTLLAFHYGMGTPFTHNCTTLLNIHDDTLSAVGNLTAIVQSCETVAINWSAPNILPGHTIDGYYLTVDELDITRQPLSNETQFLLQIPNQYSHCNASLQKTCSDFNFTVIVEPIYCGGIGNASSTTTFTKLQISEEIEYIVIGERNTSQLSVQLQAKIIAGCAFRSNVSVTFDCMSSAATDDDDTDSAEGSLINDETIPVQISENNVFTVITLHVNQTCIGTLKWIDPHGLEIQTHRDVVLRTTVIQDIPYQLEKNFMLHSYCALICCAHQVRHEEVTNSLSYCQAVDSVSTFDDDFCMETPPHTCNRDNHFFMYYINLTNQTILPSTVTSSITSSHFATSSDSGISPTAELISPSVSESWSPSPSPTVPCEPNQPMEPPWMKNYFVPVLICGTILLTSLFWIIAIIIFRNWEYVKKICCCKCSSNQQPSEASPAIATNDHSSVILQGYDLVEVNDYLTEAREPHEQNGVNSQTVTPVNPQQENPSRSFQSDDNLLDDD